MAQESLLRERPRRELFADIGLGVLLLAGAWPLRNYTLSLPTDARTLLHLVVLGLGLGGFGLISKATLKLRAGATSDDGEVAGNDAEPKSWQARSLALIRFDEIAAVGLIAGYVWLLPRLGFLLASFLALLGGAVLLGNRRWGRWLVVMLVFLLASQWLFFDYLNLRNIGWRPW